MPRTCQHPEVRGGRLFPARTHGLSGLPRPSTNGLPLTCVRQFLSHGWLTNHLARAVCLPDAPTIPPQQSLCQVHSPCLLTRPFLYGPLPILAVRLLCFWRIHNPEAMALCSCELPRPSGPVDCLTTLFSSGVVYQPPRPSPIRCFHQYKLPAPFTIRCY